MSDPFENHATGLTSPARSAFEITPNDSTDLSSVTRALWVGTEGDVVVIMQSGDEVTFSTVSGLLPIAVSRVKSTNTTASDIVGLL